jgi:hypothetical protein
MSKLREQYSSYVIEARSNELGEGLGWNSSFYLEKHADGAVTIQEWHLKATFNTEEDAVQAALQHARKKVDDIEERSCS